MEKQKVKENTDSSTIMYATNKKKKREGNVLYLNKDDMIGSRTLELQQRFHHANITWTLVH
jgi:hypothetical protein